MKSYQPVKITEATTCTFVTFLEEVTAVTLVTIVTEVIVVKFSCTDHLYNIFFLLYENF